MTLNFSPRHLLRSVFSLLLSIAATLPAIADTFGDFNYTSSVSAATITGYTGAGGVVTIPGTINGLPVVSIGSDAFVEKAGLTSVTIPDSVTSIGVQAFYGCTGLISVVIPDSVLSIGSFVFGDCTGLTSVVIGNSVTSIGTGAFAGCTSLTAFTVDALNSHYSSVNGVLFNKSQSILVAYPTGSAGNYMIPGTVTSIGVMAFSGSANQTSVIIPDSVTSIGSEAFYRCTGLTSVVIGNSVTSIGTGAFSGCTSLSGVTIGNSVTTIEGNAFDGCSNLASVIFPASVTNIGGDAFDRCYGLTGLYFLGNAPSVVVDLFGGSYSPARVYYLSGATGWKPLFSGRPTALWISLGITRQPTSVNINQGGTVIFGVTATGNSVRYQWQKDWLDIPGAISELLFLSNVQPNDAASYTAVVSDDTGSITSVPAILTVNTPPLITVQPVSATANQGGSVTFSVTAAGALFYRWQRNGSDVADATSASLTLSGLQAGYAGSYTVIVSNLTGSVTSNPVVLTVNAPFTQAQYDEVLLAGRTQVINSPNTYGLYNLSQLQALKVGTPLLTKDPMSGKFKLTIAAKKSADILTYTPLPFSAEETTINAQGEMEFQFTSPDNAAFFRLESK